MLQDLINLLTNPLVLKVLIGYWVFSAFVGALPAPEQIPQKSFWFVFFYKITFGFLHGLSGNLNRAALAFKVPGAVPNGDK